MVIFALHQASCRIQSSERYGTVREDLDQVLSYASGLYHPDILAEIDLIGAFDTHIATVAQ